jgi:hypothetical protein
MKVSPVAKNCPRIYHRKAGHLALIPLPCWQFPGAGCNKSRNVKKLTGKPRLTLGGRSVGVVATKSLYPLIRKESRLRLAAHSTQEPYRPRKKVSIVGVNFSFIILLTRESRDGSFPAPLDVQYSRFVRDTSLVSSLLPGNRTLPPTKGVTTAIGSASNIRFHTSG